MARTRLTARKQVGGFTPARATSDVTWAHQAPAEFHTTGLHAGELPRKLWSILKGLGYQEAPVYKGVRTPLSNNGYSWMVEVAIYEKIPDGDGCKVRRIHAAIAPRESFAAGIGDAARQALAVLCAEYHGILQTTPYHYYPQRASGSLEVTFAPSNREGDARLVEQVRFTDILTRELDGALDELHDTHLRLAEAEARVRDLQAKMSEDSEEEPEERPDPELPHSPSRKRLRLEAAIRISPQDLSEGGDSS